MISFSGRIPIRIYPVFWVLVLMISWLNSQTLQGIAIWSVVIFFSVLVHEYGHALTAIAFGQKAEINFVGLGGVTKRTGPSLSGPKEFLIVLNGPIFGFIFSYLAYCLIIYADHPIWVYALRITFNVNLFWTILNLLPVLPLDGGHLMRLILEGCFGFRGKKFAFFLSLLFSLLFAMFFLFQDQMIVAALFIMMAFESYRAWADLKSMTEKDEDEKLQIYVREGTKALEAGQLDEALSKFNYVRQQAPKGLLYVTATQLMARILTQQAEYKKAYDLLIPLHNRLSIDYLELYQQLAYRLEDWEESLRAGESAYQIRPSMEVALVNALISGIMNRPSAAVGWLRSSFELGLPNVKETIQKREFDPVRNSEAFQSLLKTLRI